MSNDTAKPPRTVKGKPFKEYMRDYMREYRKKNQEERLTNPQPSNDDLRDQG